MIGNLILVVSIFLVAVGSVAAQDAARGGEHVAPDQTTRGNNVFTGVARVVATYPSPVLRPAGIGWDGASLWFVNDFDQTIYKIDPATMTVLATLPAPASTWAFGLDHDGATLWGDLDEPEMVYQMDDSTGAVLDSFASPHFAPNGVVSDGAMIWHSGFGTDLTLMDPVASTVFRTIPAPGHQAPRGLELFDGSLWVVDGNTNPDDAIYRLDPSDGTVLGSYLPVDATFGLIYGLAHDGTRFWLTDLDTAQIHIIEIEETLLFYDGFESGDTNAWTGVLGEVSDFR
jgi:outer membrane protein assembly factor BamB